MQYLHHSDELRDPLEVEFTDGAGGPLRLDLAGQEWQPSHSSLRYSVGETGTIEEHRWITEDDVAVVRFAVRGLPRFGVRWRSPLASDPVGDLARYTVVPLGGLATERVLSSSVLRRGDAQSPIYFEAEAPARQVGAEGADRQAAASGEAVLGQGFGGVAGHEAAYAFMSTGVGAWTLLARYARGAEGPAQFSVQVQETGRGLLECESTGGWGEAEEHFRIARLDLGEIVEGASELVVTALADDGNTNFDGFFLVRTENAGDRLPARRSWRDLDPMRGALRLPGGRVVVDGVPFAILPPMAAQGVYRPGEPIPVPGEGKRLHLLALPVGPEAEISCAGRTVGLGPRRATLADHAFSLLVPEQGELDLLTKDCVVLAATRERTLPGGASFDRRGHLRLFGVGTEVRLSMRGLDEPWRVAVPEDGEVRFHLALEITGPAAPGAPTVAALAGDDPLTAHIERYTSWFALLCPRLYAADAFLHRLWTYRWFLVRHNLARPGAGYLPGAAVFEGRHGSWYPQAISFSAPHIIAESRWLNDPTIFRSVLAAHAAAQDEIGVFRNARVDWRGFRYTNWIPEAAVEAFKVHPDRDALRDALPALSRNVEGLARAFDADGDGLLCAGDHYATGMEFQPSFWAHVEFDNTQPPARLERPDFNSYLYGNALAVAAAARHVEREDLATRLEALGATVRDAVLQKLWHEEDGFFYAVREGDDEPARCKEIVGFYPFRFGLPPDDARYARALATLVDPAQFWTTVPVASCSKQVPAYSAAVRQWPGPGGMVAPNMWNGPTWPHAVSVVADAMAVVLRRYDQRAFQARKLGELLQRYALFHCEDRDRARLLLREYGDGESGAGEGCPDYLHSTFNDLIIRHALGIVPRFDEVLEVRPLAVGLGDLSVEDLPYHGHRIGVAIRGERLIVTIDGEVAGEGNADRGLGLSGMLR